MSLVSIKAALQNALYDIDESSDAIDIAYENDDYAPVIGTPYQEAFFMPAEPDNPTMDDNHYREHGLFQVNLHYPIKAGSGAASTRAELIKSTFYRGASFSYGGITVRIDKTPEVPQGYRTDDNWWLQPVRIRWFADIFR